jgi:hypothetical protein
MGRAEDHPAVGFERAEVALALWVILLREDIRCPDAASMIALSARRSKICGQLIEIACASAGRLDLVATVP